MFFEILSLLVASFLVPFEAFFNANNDQGPIRDCDVVGDVVAVVAVLGCSDLKAPTAIMTITTSKLLFGPTSMRSWLAIRNGSFSLIETVSYLK